MSLPDSTSDANVAWESAGATAGEDVPNEQPRGVLVRKPQTTVYTVLLLVAFLAIAFGCLLLVLELARYGFQLRPVASLPDTIRQVAQSDHSLI